MLVGEESAKLTGGNTIRGICRALPSLPKSNDGEGVLKRNETIIEWVEIKERNY